MIISRKRFNEKIQEAVNQVEKERWISDRIRHLEDECNQRIDGLHRHLCDLEQKIALIMGEKKG